MKKTIIISGGEKGGIEYAFSYKEQEAGKPYIIACDKGYRYAAEENIRPDKIIGDFDSYDGELPADIPVEKLPVEKDDTDTMHAIREAVEIGSELIVMCCAGGGRMDHYLSNIQAGRYAAERGSHVIIASKDTIIHILHNKDLTLLRNDDMSLSVLSLSDESTVSVIGTKYEAESVKITGDFPLGQSNEWASDQACISVHEGTVIVILSIFQTI